MPIDGGLHLLLDQPLHQVRAHNVLAEALLLQQLEVAQGRARVRQVFEVGRAAPVAQVGEVGDKGGLGEDLLRREVVEIVWVGEGLDELEWLR
jgi:hypothetical protein